MPSLTPAANLSPALDREGEGAFLAWVRERQAPLASGDGPVRRAAGDDLAVLDWPGGLVLLGADPVLDGVHLDVAQHGWTAAGRKAMNRNLSDVAAMAATPVAATLSLIVPQGATLADAKTIYEGAEAAGKAAGCPIVGGDFATWPGRLAVVVGILARAAAPVPRGGARPGQGLFVTGPLGGSILGRHLSFAPRLTMAAQIVEAARPSAMLDLSDGLSRDLPRLLGDAVGATLDTASVPIHDDARRLSLQTGRDPLWHALHDGEDYELLFATDATGAPPGCVRIGTVDATSGVRIRMPGGAIEPLEAMGWEHHLDVRR